MGEKGKKRGRPVKFVDGFTEFKMKMGDEEYDLLSHISIKTGKSKADVMREGLKIYGNLVEHHVG